MIRLCTIVLGGLLVAAFGCNSSPPGGPGATADSRKGTHLTQPENTFSLSAPELSTTVKQGETKRVKIGISRGKNFDQDVKLEFTGAPQGVKIVPASTELKASAKEVEVDIEASKDAALGDHTITVTGTPASGEKTSTTFKITMKKA